jgi:O-antigen ligase
MRKIAQLLLVVFAFATPWEFSLELPEPLGPIARIAGILLLIVGIPAILLAGRMRRPGAMQLAVLALYLWFCISAFWTVDHAATLEKLRAYFQEMMIVWLVWEFADSASDLRRLMRAYVSGSWVLAAVTLASFASPEAIAAGQIRFFAEGLDPNDTARFLDLGFPLAALLADAEPKTWGKALALGYLPLGIFAVLLTASRGGVVAALIALAGSAALLARSRPRRLAAGIVAVPVLAFAVWLVIPAETFERLSTIYEQVEAGNLNYRVNIWEQGRQAFFHAPVFGSGAGSFVAAARLAPIDTAHNTALSIAVGGGLVALGLLVAVIVLAARSIVSLRGPLLVAMATALVVWLVSSLTAATEENRSTWLLFALIALAGKLAAEDAEALARCFPKGGGGLECATLRSLGPLS